MSEFEVPWAIENAKHSAKLVRRAYQAQIGEGSGITRPGDLKVSALSVPGTGFRVAPGGGTAQSRDSAPAARESYGPILNEQKIVSDVPGTGSGSGRRDLVILEITDPQMESVTYPAPTDPFGTGGWLDGDNFNRITIIYGVGADVKSLDQITTGPFKNVTGITLAAINWPSNTGTITNAMITDLRQVQAPRSEVAVRAFNLAETAPDRVNEQLPNADTWPSQARDAGALDVDIPTWATSMKIVMTVSGYGVSSSSASRGRFWVMVGETGNPNNMLTQQTKWQADRPGSIRVADSIRVPRALRGTRQRFYPRAARETAANGGGTVANSIYADWATSVDLLVVFQEVADGEA